MEDRMSFKDYERLQSDIIYSSESFASSRLQRIPGGLVPDVDSLNKVPINSSKNNLEMKEKIINNIIPDCKNCTYYTPYEFTTEFGYCSRVFRKIPYQENQKDFLHQENLSDFLYRENLTSPEAPQGSTEPRLNKNNQTNNSSNYSNYSNDLVTKIFCNTDLVRKYGPCGINGTYYRESVIGIKI
jgi:hypothetical protein